MLTPWQLRGLWTLMMILIALLVACYTMPEKVDSLFADYRYEIEYYAVCDSTIPVGRFYVYGDEFPTPTEALIYSAKNIQERKGNCCGITVQSITQLPK